MNGNNYFLDTNAIIALLHGNTAVDNFLQKALWIGTSVVCMIEFLSYTKLSPADKDLLLILSNRIQVVPVENTFRELEQIAKMRMHNKLKLPDAIIAASALANNAVLLSNDRHFTSIPNLTVVSF